MSGRTSRGLQLAALLCLASACGEPQDLSGTNTNWLRRCTLDADCGSSLECLCGRCTVACSTNTDCPQAGLCASREAALLQCAGVASRTCQEGCVSDDQCATGQLCHHGTCTDPLPTTPCTSDGGTLICEDFEGDLGRYTPIVTEGNTVEALPAGTPSGAKALIATVTAAPSVAYLRADIPAQTSGTLALGGWVRVPEDNMAHDMAPLGLWSDDEVDWALRLVVKDAALELWSYTTPLTDSFALVPGAWHCLQADITIGEVPDGAVVVSVDGQIIAEAVSVDTLPTSGISAMTMGTQWAGAPAQIQVDRIRLGSTPIGCWD